MSDQFQSMKDFFQEKNEEWDITGGSTPNGSEDIQVISKTAISQNEIYSLVKEYILQRKFKIAKDESEFNSIYFLKGDHPHHMFTYWTVFNEGTTWLISLQM